MSLNHIFNPELYENNYNYRRLCDEHREIDRTIDKMKHMKAVDPSHLKHLKIAKLRLADQMQRMS